MAPEWTALPATLDLLGECPLWDRATRTLFWTDIPGKALKSWHPATGEHRTWLMPDEVGSFALRGRGGALLAMRSGFALFDFATRELRAQVQRLATAKTGARMTGVHEAPTERCDNTTATPRRSCP